MKGATERWGAIAAALLLAAAAPAAAQIYHWTDADGHEHFSSDPAGMPRGAQKSARPGPGTLNSAPAPKATAPAAPAASTDRGAGAAPAGDLAGGHDEAWWRAERARQIQEIDALGAKVAGCKSGEPPRDEAAGLPDEAAGLRTERHGAKLRAAAAEECTAATAELESKRRGLESFDESARQQGVPPGWLR